MIEKFKINIIRSFIDSYPMRRGDREQICKYIMDDKYYDYFYKNLMNGYYENNNIKFIIALRDEKHYDALNKILSMYRKPKRKRLEKMMEKML